MFEAMGLETKSDRGQGVVFNLQLSGQQIQGGKF